MWWSVQHGDSVSFADLPYGSFTHIFYPLILCINFLAHLEFKEIFEKAQCLVQYTSLITEEKLMLLDIQGSGYSLYDPEIATADLIDEGEVFFCCGNLSSIY